MDLLGACFYFWVAETRNLAALNIFHQATKCKQGQCKTNGIHADNSLFSGDNGATVLLRCVSNQNIVHEKAVRVS